MPITCIFNDPAEEFSVAAWQEHLEMLRALPEDEDFKAMYIRMAERRIASLEELHRSEAEGQAA